MQKVEDLYSRRNDLTLSQLGSLTAKIAARLDGNTSEDVRNRETPVL